MKDTYQDPADQALPSDDNWVVIRRRTPVVDALDEDVVEQPARELLDDAVLGDADDADTDAWLDELTEELQLNDDPAELDSTDETATAAEMDLADWDDEEEAALDPADEEPAFELEEMTEDEVAETLVLDEDVQIGSRDVAAVVDTAPVTQFAAPAIARGDKADYDAWHHLDRVSIGAQVDGKLARRALPSLVEYFRADPIAKGFDLLRTRLVRTIRAYGWRRIAVVAPGRNSGATFTAVNLALSLSRVPGSRTILMDMNQRDPGVADALGVRRPGRLDQFLRAESALEDYLVRVGDTLALGLADQPSDLAAEVLHDPLTGEVLDDMIETLNPDLVLYDLPAMLSHDDLAAFLPNVDGVLLVTDGTQTTPEHISACEKILEGQTQLLGVVLNRARVSKDRDGFY